MKTETEDSTEYDDFTEVTIKSEGSTTPSTNVSAPSTPLTTWPYNTLLTPQCLVAPSQLVLTDLLKRPSSPSASSSTAEPPAKKVKRKARTEEEKEARAYERTMRNRRAAQESRDRKKRQFEILEEENRRLQEENQQMKRRIEQLESQQIQLQLPTSPEVIVKEEFSPGSFDSTFHPAVMELKNDQQCLSISLRNSYSLMNYQFWMLMSMNLHPLFSTLFSLMIRISLMHHKGLLAYSPATFNSLNIGSLFTGAENRLRNSLCH
jgi:hypothetical protein